MDNRIKIYLVILTLVLIGVGYMEVQRPKQIDWSPYYTTSKKTPYGLYVLDKEFKSLFKDQNILKLDQTPYEYFNAHYDYDSTIQDYDVRGTYFSVENESILDEESAKELLVYVSRGNEAFLSAHSFSEVLLDSLNIQVNGNYGINDSTYAMLSYLDSSTYVFNKNNYKVYFDSLDTAQVEVIGRMKIQDEDSMNLYPNFIRIPYGDGYFLLHSFPSAFTNYHLLHSDRHGYAANVLSFIQDIYPIYWNTNNYSGTYKSDSPLRFILENESLRWAWYFILIGFLTYLIFNAKRKQRIIPIIPPVLNTTVDFTKTIANLYFQEGHFKTVMEKRIIYFLERVRTEYHIDTQILDGKFIQKLHLKSGKPKELIEKIVKKISGRKLNRYLSENDLVELNTLLEEFWSRQESKSITYK